MWQILHASFYKFSKPSNSGRISLNWSITDEVTTCNRTAYFFGALCTFPAFLFPVYAMSRLRSVEF